MSKNQVSIHQALEVMNQQMPNLRSRSHTDYTGLMDALRGMGFKGWHKILNDQGNLRGMAEEAFEDDEINIYFQECDFEEKSEIWITVVDLLQDRGSMLDAFIEPAPAIGDESGEYCGPSAIDSGRVSRSLEKLKENREIIGDRFDGEQRRGYDRIISLDESDELSRLPTSAPKNPRMGQMWLSVSEHMVYVWNGKQWMDSGDRVNEKSGY